MLYTKKTLAIILASIVLGGGAWYLNTTGVLDGLSSSVFGPTFVCSEENLKKQAKEYRQKIIQQRKATVYREEIEATIITLRDSGKTLEMKEQQKALRTLIRAIGAYNRFIKTYTACQEKIQSMPLIPVPLPDTTHVLNSAAEDTDMSQKDIVKDTVMGTPKSTSPDMNTPSSDKIGNPTVSQSPVTIPPPVTVVPDSTYTPTTTESSDDTSSAVNNTIEPPITENTVETIPSMPAVPVPETTDPPSPSL